MGKLDKNKAKKVISSLDDSDKGILRELLGAEAIPSGDIMSEFHKLAERIDKIEKRSTGTNSDPPPSPVPAGAPKGGSDFFSLFDAEE